MTSSSSRRAGFAAEQVEGADDLGAQPHRHGIGGSEPGFEGDGGEAGPAAVGGGEVLVDDGFAAAIAVQARSFLRLQLEQLDDPHRLAGRRHHPQLAVGGDEHDPGGGDVEDLDATIRQRGQQVDDVEVVDEVVGQLDEGAGEQRFACHGHLGPREPPAAPLAGAGLTGLTLRRVTPATEGRADVTVSAGRRRLDRSGTVRRPRRWRRR